jgi:hypothetical protein
MHGWLVIFHGTIRLEVHNLQGQHLGKPNIFKEKMCKVLGPNLKRMDHETSSCALKLKCWRWM